MVCYGISGVVNLSVNLKRIRQDRKVMWVPVKCKSYVIFGSSFSVFNRKSQNV